MNNRGVFDRAVERVRVENLIPYARNARTHSDEQVAQIAASIREFGFVAPILIDAENNVIAGHGRLLAARKIGMTEVPCLRVEHLTETQKRAYILADNRLALNAGWDEEMLRLELEELEELGQGLDVIGFSPDEIASLCVGGEDREDDAYYTRKIEPPIYRPTGEKPSVDELYDASKTAALVDEIDKADIPEDVKRFLRAAAERHTAFHFRKIAEFYAHAEPRVQELMERSALVIIDAGKAIENGFVQLTSRLARQFVKDHGASGDA